MPSHPREYKKIPDTAHFHLADSDDDLSQIDPIVPSEITVRNGHGESSTIDLIICGSTDSYDDQELDSPPERSSRVRFRSRVRIGSGLNRHRHKHLGVDYLSSDFSPAPSLSGSPSSSISAPLRTQTDEQVGKPGWGTLGQRVSMFAKVNMEQRRSREQASSFRTGVEPGGFRGEQVIPYSYYVQVDEETPLLSGFSHSDSTAEDKVFGPWPGRLANPYWWWWHIESIICCYCLDDIDD